MIKRIKNFLKRILPPSIHSFNYKIAGTWKKMTALHKELRSMLIQQKRELEKIDGKKIYWTSVSERGYVERYWGRVTEAPDFEEKFLRLTSGMDGESVRKITRILSRHKAMLNCDSQAINMFTKEEQEEIRRIRDNFYQDIFDVSESLYAYKNYLLPVREFSASVFYHKHGINELETLEKVRGKSIIDVGGYIGDSVLVLSEIDCKNIYTFEPEPDNLANLKKTLELNRCENVIVEDIALSNTVGTLTIYAADDSTSSVQKSVAKFKREVVVPVTTLDMYVAEHNLDVGLIKVDIEGAERLFLEGAKQTICEQKPILLLSIYHNADDFFNIKPLIESWNLGYTFKIHRPASPRYTFDTMLLAEVIDP